MQSLCMMAYIQIALYRRMRERARARIDVTDKRVVVAMVVSSLRSLLLRLPAEKRMFFEKELSRNWPGKSDFAILATSTR